MQTPHPKAAGVAAWVHRNLGLFRPGSSIPRLDYTSGLIAFAGSVFAGALGLAVATVRTPADTATVGLAAVVVAILGSYSVNVLSGLGNAWNANGFIHLAVTITFGPVGAAAASLGEIAGWTVRFRGGWFRAAFNLSAYFIADMAAYAAFQACSTAAHPGFAWRGMAGLVAGAAQWLVNHLLLAFVSRLSGTQSSAWAVMRRAAGLLPFSLGYGWSAVAAMDLYVRVGVAGFSALLVPVVLLQGFLVVLARRVDAHTEEQRRYARDREALLRRAIDASAAERRRIARDLHDGVVQNLAAFALQLDTTAEHVRSDDARPERLLDDAVEVMEVAADQTRAAIRDLRTLILEIAPGDAQDGRAGLVSALERLGEPLRAAGVRLSIDVPDVLDLPVQATELVVRVAQESLRNIVHHAGARAVRVAMTIADGDVPGHGGRRLTLAITDDGRGFDADDVARRRAQGHVGTRLLASLCEDAGAGLDITSQPGRGTTVSLTCPLRAER